MNPSCVGGDRSQREFLSQRNDLGCVQLDDSKKRIDIKREIMRGEKNV